MAETDESILENNNIDAAEDSPHSIDIKDNSDNAVNAKVDEAAEPMSSTDLFIALFFAALDLAENIFTIFFFSSNFSFGFVFISFLAADIFCSAADVYKSVYPGPGPDYLSIVIEFMQAVVYIYFCDYIIEAKIFFPIIAAVQCLAPLSAILDNKYEKTSQFDEFGPAFSKRIAGIGFGIGVLLFTFTTSNAIYQDYWYQIALTVYIWVLTFILDNFSTYSFSSMASTFLPQFNIKTEKSFQYGDVLGFVAMYVIALITFGAAIYYYQHGINSKYDYAVTILSIISGAMMLFVTLCGCCLFGFIKSMGMTIAEFIELSNQPDDNDDVAIEILRIQKELAAMRQDIDVDPNIIGTEPQNDGSNGLSQDIETANE